MLNSTHGRKHQDGRGRVKHRMRSRPHEYSISILRASVQMLDNKQDDLHARISFQQNIRNRNVLCFTESWLNPGIPDSSIQQGGGRCVTVIHLPGTVDWVMMRSCFGFHFMLEPKKQDKCGSHQQFFGIVQLVWARGQAENFAYWLELNGHWHLTWEATLSSIHEGIATAIMNSDCLVFLFSLLWSRRRYRIHQASTESSGRATTLRPRGSWKRTLPQTLFTSFIIQV